jgi:hypothetical protein
MALILHAATYCRILRSGSRLCRLPSPRLLNASHRLPSRGRQAEHFQPENAVYRRLTRGPPLNSFLSYRCLSQYCSFRWDRPPGLSLCHAERARPPPIFPSAHPPRHHRILLDIANDLGQLFQPPHPMIVRFILPKRQAGAPNDAQRRHWPGVPNDS